MKLVVFACLFGAAVAVAELPRFRPARFRSQRIELAPTTTDSPTESTTDGAPYTPSGWRPAGQPFSLPNEQVAPADSYGAPQESGPYPPSGWKPDQPFTLPKQQVPPATSYGVPETTYGAPDAETTTPTPDNPRTQKLAGPVEVQKSMGEYYVLLPDGRLQKIEFATENDIQNMKYTARLQLRNPAPLFVFGP